MSRRKVTVDIRIDVHGESITIKNKPLSPWGIFGLSWRVAIPSTLWGARVRVHIDTKNDLIGPISVVATIVEELVGGSSGFGLKFDEVAHKKVLGVLSGLLMFEERDFLDARKLPRIPAELIEPDWELKMLAFRINPAEKRQSPRPIPLEIVNLSPTGLLLRSSREGLAQIKPHDHLNLVLMGREDLVPESGVGLATRVAYVRIEPGEHVDERVRYLGLKVSHMGMGARRDYFKLLENALNELRRKHAELKKKPKRAA